MNYSFEIHDIILFKKVVSLKSVSSCTLLDKSVIVFVLKGLPVIREQRPEGRH